MCAITGNDVLTILRRAINGETVLYLHPKQKMTWDEAYVGTVRFTVDNWEIVFSNDCGQVDYVDHVISPHGEELDFDTMDDDNSEPIDMLSEEEEAALIRLVRAAPRKIS